MKRGRGGVRYEEIIVGDGPIAERDSTVDVIYTLSLNRGDVVQSDMRYTFRLTDRELVAGLRYGVEGMRVGGHRRVRIGPHLAYRHEGVPGRVPADAVLVFDVQLLAVRNRPE
jgi:FKBP-type peptidyl-prolyl cis-trans isomerase